MGLAMENGIRNQTGKIPFSENRLGGRWIYVYHGHVCTELDIHVNGKKFSDILEIRIPVSGKHIASSLLICILYSETVKTLPHQQCEAVLIDFWIQNIIVQDKVDALWVISILPNSWWKPI